MAETNNKFLQILRNFQSTTRAQAIAKLEAAANSKTLYHAGTPVVAFYSTADSKTFAYRSAPNTYGDDVTKNYSAVFGIMGEQEGDIEIFDIQTSVEDLIGGASEFTTAASSVFPSKTWDCRSLGGIQVVLEDMEGILTTEIGDLKTRITNLTGQSGPTYVPAAAATEQNPNGAHYINNATSLQNAVERLDTALNTIAGQVTANTVTNTDNSIDIDTQGTNTVVSVNLDENDHVLALDATNGIYTNILIKKVVRTGEGSGAEGAAGTNEVIDTLGTNVKEAYRLYGTDNTQLGRQIDIYKDSSLKEVYLGASTDTIDASTGVITKNQVTDPQSMNFAYQLADGTYSLTKIDVSKFLTESEFGDGLDVSGAGVVSVKKDTTSGKVRTADTPSGVTPGDDGDTGLVDVLTVSSNGVKVDNIQAAIDYAVAHGGTSIINSTMNALSDGTVRVVNTNQGGVNHIAIKQGTDASGAKTYEFLENDIASKAALNAEVTRAQNAEDEIADLVGLGVTEGARTYTPVVTPETGETAATTVKEDIALLDAHVEALSDAIDGLNGSATASNVAAGTDTTPNADFTVLTKVNQVEGEIQEVGAAATDSKSVLLKKVAATGAATDVSYSNTNSQMVATNVQAAIDELKADTLEAKTVVVGEADAAHADPNTAENGVYVTQTADQTDGHAIYTVAIDVFDCGEYTVTVEP